MKKKGGKIEWFAGREFLTLEDWNPAAVSGSVELDAENKRILVVVDLRDLVGASTATTVGGFQIQIDSKQDVRKELNPIAVVGSLLQQITLSATEAHEELNSVIQRRKGM